MYTHMYDYRMQQNVGNYGIARQMMPFVSFFFHFGDDMTQHANANDGFNSKAGNGVFLYLFFSLSLPQQQQQREDASELIFSPLNILVKT